MRSRILAVLAVSFGVVMVAGCNRTEEAAAPPAPEAAPAATAAYDLSPESNAKFLTDNAAKPGVTQHPSGLQYRVIKAGTGISPTPDDLVTVTYKGNLIDGTVFDQTEPGQTAEFPAGGLIQGWVLALQIMKEGDEWELVIPAEIGYGATGAGGVIPPNQTLVFTMGLQKVAKAQ